MAGMVIGHCLSVLIGDGWIAVGDTRGHYFKTKITSVSCKLLETDHRCN